MSIERVVIDIIEGRRKGKIFLLFLSFGFRFVVALRNFFYKPYKTSKLVISVGSITAGGSGKTPITALLAKELSSSKRVAILTRGYRSQVEKAKEPRKIEGINPSFFGDEPTWLQKQVPQCAIWVGKNRVESAKRADADILILDDGMQHRALKADIQIIVLDALDPFGKGHFLPRGYLRDHPKRLKVADLIILHNISDETHFKRVEPLIRKFSSAPLVGTRYAFIEKKFEKKVGTFCSIAKPHHFVSMVENHGAQCVKQLILPDHRPFTLTQLAEFSDQCLKQGAKQLVCTAKDRVKLPPQLNFSLPVITCDAEIKIVVGSEHWYNLIQTLSR